MPDRFTNLLPPEHDRALSREYALRLAVVAAVLVTVLTLIAALLLVPTYVYLGSSERAKKTQLATIESRVSPEEDTAFSARLAALTSNAATLIALSSTPAASARIRDTLMVPRSGVTLSGFTYTPAAPQKPGALVVSGIASTRDALREYQLALQGAPFVASAALPVSAFAKDSNIAFTITLALTP